MTSLSLADLHQPAPDDRLQVGEPQAGWYRVRLVKNGPFVAARIYRPAPVCPWTGAEIDRFYPLAAEINGEPAEVMWLWERCAGKPITEAEYRYLLTVARTPGQPEATPLRAIDPLRSPITF